MKKVLSFALLLSSLFLANVQGQIAFLYNGQTYENGDSVNCYTTINSLTGLTLKNTSDNNLRDLVVIITPIEEHGIHAWGVCAGGRCVEGLTSSKFNLNAGATDDMFAIDINIDPDVPDAYSVYTVQVKNSSVNCSFTLRINYGTLGIEETVLNSSILAYPNPAQGTFTVRYEAEQPATLIVIDMQGRTVRSIPVQGNGTLNINDLPAGMYAYGIAGGMMQKLIVK